VARQSLFGLPPLGANTNQKPINERSFRKAGDLSPPLKQAGFSSLQFDHFKIGKKLWNTHLIFVSDFGFRASNFQILFTPTWQNLSGYSARARHFKISTDDSPALISRSTVLREKAFCRMDFSPIHNAISPQRPSWLTKVSRDEIFTSSINGLIFWAV
jgi:hypothetical protein